MKRIQLIGLLIFGFVIATNAQESFTTQIDNATTSVKNQQRTGTCWCYSTISFLESELLREGKKEIDLSEMFVVHQTYLNKASQYLKKHGKTNFSEGGQAHDVIRSISQAGLVPQKEYLGNNYDTLTHNHSEMEAAVKGMLDGVIAKKKSTLSTTCLPAVDGILSAYMGEMPENFEFEGKTYSPQSFAKEYANFDAANYIEFTSYTHHPFYQNFVLELPDNWSNDTYYNLPIDELMQTMDEALENGYTIVWDGDVSEKGFQHGEGKAELPENTEFDQEARQTTFMNWKTTDDHLMHITGTATKDGKKYYKTKNSWSAKSNKEGGYLYMSEEYVRLKTVAILVNKSSVPKQILKKLN